MLSRYINPLRAEQALRFFTLAMASANHRGVHAAVAELPGATIMGKSVYVEQRMNGGGRDSALFVPRDNMEPFDMVPVSPAPTAPDVADRHARLAALNLHNVCKTRVTGITGECTEWYTVYMPERSDWPRLAHASCVPDGARVVFFTFPAGNSRTAYDVYAKWADSCISEGSVKDMAKGLGVEQWRRTGEALGTLGTVRLMRSGVLVVTLKDGEARTFRLHRDDMSCLASLVIRGVGSRRFVDAWERRNVLDIDDGRVVSFGSQSTRFRLTQEAAEALYQSIDKALS